MIQSLEQPDSCPQPANGREHTHTLCLLSNLYTWVTQCGCTHKHTASMTSSLSTPCNWERSSLHPHSDTPLNPLLYYTPISKYLCHPQRVTLAVYPCTAVKVVILILKKGSIKWVYEIEREREGGARERKVWCGVLRDKSNSSGAQATASGGKQCPFCPNKPHQDSWHEVWGIDISSRYAVCCPPALGKEKRWFNMLHCPRCCRSWALQLNLGTLLILFSSGWSSKGLSCLEQGCMALK